MAKKINVNNGDEVLRLEKEGLPFFQQYFYPSISYFTGDGVKNPNTDGGLAGSLNPFAPRAIGSYVVPYTKCIYINNIYAWASRNCYIACGVNTSLGGVFGNYTPVGSQGSVFKIDRLAYPQQNVSAASYGIIDTFTPSTDNKISALATFNGILISDDLNFGATKRILIIGDSNSVGEFGTDIGINADCVYTHKLRNYYRTLGHNVRLIDKAKGGWSTVNYKTLQDASQLDVETPNLIIYHLGTNDSTNTTYASNLTAFLNYALLKYPSAKILVISPLPAQGTDASGWNAGGAKEIRLATIRMAATNTVQSFITATPSLSTRLAYINAGESFSVNDNSQYSSAETVGNHIHIGKIGHETLFNFIVNKIESDFQWLKVI